MNFFLPHLEYYDMGIEKYNRIFSTVGKVSKKLLFFNDTKSLNEKLAGETISLEASKVYADLINGQLPPQGFGLENSEYSPRQNKAVDTLVFFLAVIRTSIMNNVSNPLQGPPTVRINFGTTYQDIPCLVKDYSINFDESGNYDVDTLTPRKFDITLNLVEVRLGDFTTFEKAHIVKRDNLAGWESVGNKPYSIDPGYISN